jgi:hypothetical protein
MSDLETPTKKLAEAYLELGGTRRAKLDDNIVDTRQWEDEPAEATAFWEKEIAPLAPARLREVETHLPTLNSD